MLLGGDDLFKGTVLIGVPHSDDEVLGCGAAIAEVRDKTRLHFVYVSDGAGSPAPPRGPNPAASTLPRLRRGEALAALASLGVPPGNATFLGFEDGALARREDEIERRFLELCERLKPQTIVAPFRYDSHHDHLAVNRVAMSLVYRRRIPATLLEYFIYFRLRLLPKKDIRAYLNPRFVRQVYSEQSMRLKRSALNCYASQCTVMYPWQTRPILDPTVLDAVVQMPECYLQSDAQLRDRDIFTGSPSLIKLAHFLEWPLKKHKDRLTALLRGGARRSPRSNAN